MLKRAGGARHKKPRRREPPLAVDIEAPLLPRRRSDAGGRHGMAPPSNGGLDPDTGYKPLPAPGRGLSTRDDEDALKRDEDVRVKLQERAKRLIISAESPEHLIALAEEHIDEDWLFKVEEMKGNFYYFLGFGVFFNPKDGCPMNVARFLGCFTIWLLQVIGPPSIFLSSALGWGIEEKDQTHWAEWTFNTSEWEKYHVTKLLSVIFIFCFILNALFVALDDYKTWSKIDKLFDYLQAATSVKLTGEKWLWLGALTNCWVMIWCAFDTFLLIGACTTPKDVIFDALSLLFLFNIDDVGSELGFVSQEDWPGARLGWMVDNMVKIDWQPPAQLRKAGSEDNSAREMMIDAGSNCMTPFIHCIYYVTIALVTVMSVALPVATIFTPFHAMAPDD